MKDSLYSWTTRKSHGRSGETYDVVHPGPRQLPQQAGSTTAPSDPPNTLRPAGSSDNNNDENNNYSDNNNDKNNKF